MIAPTDRALDWISGRWVAAPLATEMDGHSLIVTAAEGSDLWRSTSYGFVHEDGHGLVQPLEVGSAVEVSFVVDYESQFDQAGVLVWADPRHWLKAGVEVVDSVPHLGAVATREVSDWSAAPVPDWFGCTVTLRASRAGDALTIRARPQDGPWRMVRLAPWPPEQAAEAGPYCCAPTRAGLKVRFTSWRTGPPDDRLHE